MKNRLAHTALVITAVALATIGLSGCGSTGIKVSETRVNADRFENAQDFIARAERVNLRAVESALLEKAAEDARKAGQPVPEQKPLSRDEVFRILGNCDEGMNPVNPKKSCDPLTEQTPNFYRMDDASLRSYFGNFQFADAERAIAMQRFISLLDGWTLPYALSAKYFSLEAPLNKKECSRGPQLSYVTIFKREHTAQKPGNAPVYHQRVVGTAVVESCESKILVDPSKAFDAIGAGAIFKEFFSK